MRNYIVLNGTNSNTIDGLLIQQLAPISKPLIRTQVEEIDGRDGDIVTRLGFSAYDKEITIGLYGEFDINEVIAFFNSEGTVIFSNEPDKYYNYQIIDQIDFERLVRYRTAKVKMHCQPFKYSTTEEAETLGDKGTVSSEGSALVLEDTGEAPFSKLEPKGNTIQASTPTPSAPVPVQTVTGRQTVTITGKNLFDVSSTPWGSKVAYNGSGAQVWWDGYYGIIEYQPVRPNTQYTFSNSTGKPIHYGIVFYDANKTKLSNIFNDTTTFTTPANCAYIRFAIQNSSAPTWTQLELGNQATAYEAFKGQEYGISLTQNLFDSSRYTGSFYLDSSGAEVSSGAWDISDYIPVVSGQTYSYQGLTNVGNVPYSAFYNASKTFVSSFKQATGSNTLAIPTGVSFVRFSIYDNAGYADDKTTFKFWDTPNQIELCKIGTYQDRIFKENGKWYLHKEIGKITFASSTAWTKHSTTNGNVFMLSNTGFIGYPYNSGHIAQALMDTDEAIDLGTRPDSANGVFGINTGSQLRVFRGTYDASYTADTFKAEMVGHYIYGALATPTTTEITNEALISQLEALKQAHTYKGRTHVMALAATGNAPHIIEAEAYKSSDGTITNSGNYISKPKLTIYGSGNIGVYLNGYQMFDIALGDEGYITIDTNAMEAYKDTPNNLKNRLVTGEYENFALQVGENQITFSGAVTKCIVENYSRWL